MRLRVRKQTPAGFKRIESFSKIDNVVIEENLLSPEKESISIFFKGDDSSGILNITTKEFESLSNSVKSSIRLVKPLKKTKSRKSTSKKIKSKKTKKIKKTKGKKKAVSSLNNVT